MRCASKLPKYINMNIFQKALIDGIFQLALPLCVCDTQLNFFA
jgi:hypothetical protein